MKKTDIAMIVLIAAIGIIGAFFVTKSILGSGSTDEVSVDRIESISASIDEVDPTIFNSNAINPAVKVELTEQAQ